MSQDKISNDELKISLIRELARSTYLERRHAQINIEILAFPVKNQELVRMDDCSQKETEKQPCSQEILISKLPSSCLNTDCY